MTASTALARRTIVHFRLAEIDDRWHNLEIKTAADGTILHTFRCACAWRGCFYVDAATAARVFHQHRCVPHTEVTP
jgi:hypothetical protein